MRLTNDAVKVVNRLQIILEALVLLAQLGSLGRTLHKIAEHIQVEWLLNDFYDVPFGCFVPERGEGLLAAGRCLSAEHEAVASARVTAQCFSYGHAIGHASVIALREGVAPRKISGRDVRVRLNADGARLD